MCANSQCVAGKLKVCDDGNACTIDASDAVNACVAPAKSCDDNDACTVDSCDPASGCAYVAKKCDDGNPCSVDACDKIDGCKFDGPAALNCHEAKDNDKYGNPLKMVAAYGKCDEGYVTDKTDCCDGNAQAHPNDAGGYMAVHRGDGSFDYNCDGVISQSLSGVIYLYCQSAILFSNGCTSASGGYWEQTSCG